MLTGYNDTHKAYRLVDIETDRIIFSRDVVFDEERGPFQLSPPIVDSKDQPLNPSDLGVRLPLGPPDGRAPAVPVPAPTLVPSPARSPRHATAPPNFPQDSSNLLFDEPDPVAPPTSDVGTSTLRPKWWARTIADLHDDELIEGRTARKTSKHPDYVNFALMANIHSVYEPQSYTEAKGIPEWEQAMATEHQSLLKNNTWVLSDLLLGKKPIRCKWVYKVKYNIDGTLDKYKAHLVAKGFTQHKGIDYEETFALTAKMSTIRLVLAMATQCGWKVHQMDVKSAFLHGELQEEVYMTQLPRFKVVRKEHQVLKLVKALYGLVHEN